MKTLRYTLLFVLALAATSLSAQQKYGHMNYGNLLAELPAVKAADQQLDAFQKPILEQIQSKYSALEQKFAAAQKSVSDGSLSPVQQKQKESELQNDQQVIAQMEQKAQADIMKKREELLQPIFNRIKAAVDAVATEGGYSYIFDTSTGHLLYAPESQDVTALVKAKL